MLMIQQLKNGTRGLASVTEHSVSMHYNTVYHYIVSELSTEL